MKMLKTINIIISCLLVIMVTALSSNLVVYAVEATEEKESVSVSFNSVVEIESYSIDGGYIEAGKETNITLTLHNTNRTSDVHNLVVVSRSNSGMIYPKYGDDNQFYVGDLKAGSKTTIAIPILVSADFSGDYVDFICDLVYVCGGQRCTNSASMILIGKSYDVIAVNSLEVSAHAAKNSQSLLSIGYSNKGSDNIIDAKLVIEGNVSESTREIELGAIAAGKAYNKDFNVIFTESGDQTISVMLSYTDLSGEAVQTGLGTFRVNVTEENVSTIIEKAPNPILVWVGRGIAAVSLFLAVIAVIVYIKKR